VKTTRPLSEYGNSHYAGDAIMYDIRDKLHDALGPEFIWKNTYEDRP
jgi:hypothetical protein